MSDRQVIKINNEKIKKNIQIQFSLYILLLIRFIVFKCNLKDLLSVLSRWKLELVMYNLGRANFKPLYTINNYIDKYRLEGVITVKIFLNLVGNIIAFIPLGFCLPILLKKCKSLISTLKSALLIVMVIEVTQLITTLGSFDVDDILLNILGATIGYLMYKIAIIVIKKVKFNLLQFK